MRVVFFVCIFHIDEAYTIFNLASISHSIILRVAGAQENLQHKNPSVRCAIDVHLPGDIISNVNTYVQGDRLRAELLLMWVNVLKALAIM